MTPLWFRRELHIGDEGPDVRIVRRKLGLPPDGPYDSIVAERIRGMGRHAKVNTDGEVNADVAEALGEAEATKAGLAPEWFTRELELWNEGEDVRALRNILGLGTADDRYDPDAEAAVRRFQSANKLRSTGRVTEKLAQLLGDA
jgi:peptidoglycan hydrolase-like protein with peptidoglycan-binding domain